MTVKMVIVRRKKEEGRRKKEEGRRKKEEGRRKREELTITNYLFGQCPMPNAHCPLPIS
ncbi:MULTISPECIES: hypothetical protein [unclassified Microcoleus]|uniref:hypothetical protein n=1 Tax=unclassified Microcoleus TaxID=2642155 RepID=UPI001DE8559B|nr:MULTISPECIES: hypothetical protein [unclassified Microcoleus]MCC3542451.1 hypothetical protein [Microcoleus sp. PH2017_22_RUC_O_B]